MAAIIELKYFNSFVLKKIKSIADVNSGFIGNVADGGYDEATKTFTLVETPNQSEMNVGQEITIDYNPLGGGARTTYRGYITERIDDSNFIVKEGPVDWNQIGRGQMKFGRIINFDKIPAAYSFDANEDWLIEESRIRGGFNNKTVDLGTKAYIVDDEAAQSHKFSGLIHSGVFNSRTGFNATNQFSVAEDITRTIDPANGSIQKLYAEDTNLIIFQENKVSKSLIDKDAIYTAEGNPSVTATNKVIGQNVAYAGEFGISKDPESFAVFGYRKYFTDRNQSLVCRLSMDGITPISNFGMTDYFRDALSAAGNIRGGWDDHNKHYVLSMSVPAGYGAANAYGPVPEDDYLTLAFDEASKGWVSRYTYNPNSMFSMNNNFYSTYKGEIWQHYKFDGYGKSRGRYYGEYNDSSVTLVFNGGPSLVKNFQTINYEGDSGWTMKSFKTNADDALEIGVPFFATTLEQMEENMFANNFKVKEDKYYGSLINASPVAPGEVVFGTSSSGVKGFFGEVTMNVSNETNEGVELFAVSTTFVPSS